MRHVLSLLVVTLVALQGATAGPLQLTILHINDHHSNHGS
jgi:2',3'-cyclic-nucleotide 2'-phosphodiesterase (5'-nucleotidase family)